MKQILIWDNNHYDVVTLTPTEEKSYRKAILLYGEGKAELIVHRKNSYNSKNNEYLQTNNNAIVESNNKITKAIATLGKLGIKMDDSYIIK